MTKTNLISNPIKLIHFDVENEAGLIYEKYEFVKNRTSKRDGEFYNEIDRLNEKSPIYGQFKFGKKKTNKYNASHSFSNFKINEDWLVADLTVLNKNFETILKNIIFKPRAVGTERIDRTVDLHKIKAFDAIIKKI